MLKRAYLESVFDSPTETCAYLLQESMASLRCHIEVKDIAEYAQSPDAIPLELLGYTTQERLIPITAAKSVESNDSTSPSDDETSKFISKTYYSPHGPRIGWLEYGHIDLIPAATLAAANSMAFKSGAQLLPSKKAFGKLLASTEWIATQSKDRNTYKVRRGPIAYDVWRIHPFRLFEKVLDWGDFDVGSYEEMVDTDRRLLALQKQEEYLRKLRGRLTDYQTRRLLNPHLTETDRQRLLIPDPIPQDPRIGNLTNLPRNFPVGPPINSLPGYGDPVGDGLLS